jgi:thioredoxin 1
MGEIITLKDDDFNEKVNKYPLILVDFWADWCYPCKMVAPVIEELAKEYDSKLVCAKINVDENPSVALKYQIMSVPTVLIFKDGKPVERIIGAVPKSYFIEKLRNYL